MNFFKRVSDLLDAADEKTTNADLQTITQAAEGAAAKVQSIDLGLAEGWQDLKGQIAGDLKELTLPTELSLKDLKLPTDVAMDNEAHHVSPEARLEELRGREADQHRTRDRLQQLLDEASVQLEKLKSSDTHMDEVTVDTSVQVAHFEDEFCDRQSRAEVRLDSLGDQLTTARARNEPLCVELQFWQSRAQEMLDARGLGSPEAALELCTVRSSEARCVSALLAAPIEEERAREEYERNLAERLEQQHVYEGFEKRLVELMRDSDAAMQRAEEQQQRERELQSSLKSAESRVEVERASATEASQSLRCALEAHESAKLRCREELQGSRGSAEESQSLSEAGRLRKEADRLRETEEQLCKETSAMEARLRKHRFAAAADLERAVPLASGGFWRNFDGATMKVVNILVRSMCLRRVFAVHLLLTWAWLCVLLFRLEKHP